MDEHNDIGALSTEQIDTIKAEDLDLLTDTLTIDTSNMGATGSGYFFNTTAGLNGTSGSYLTSTGASGTVWTTNNTSPWSIGNVNYSPNPNPSPGLKVNGDAEFEGKVMINGRNISEFMETISKRLAILVPDPAKLEHFEALKKAYQHYKTLEALCEIPKEEPKE